MELRGLTDVKIPPPPERSCFIWSFSIPWRIHWACIRGGNHAFLKQVSFLVQQLTFWFTKLKAHKFCDKRNTILQVAVPFLCTRCSAIESLLEKWLCYAEFDVLIAVVMNRSIFWELCLPPAFRLVSCWAYPSTLKTEAICSSETSVLFQLIARRFIQGDRTIHGYSISDIWFFSYVAQVDSRNFM